MLERNYFYVGVFTCLIIACAALANSEDPEVVAAPSAEEAKPLKVGDRLPAVEVTREDGTVTKFSEALAGQASAIVFYRGHWCPFCVKHLTALQEISGDLEAMGVKLVGVAPDKPEHIAGVRKKAELGFAIYSDSKLDLAKAMGVAFQLDPETAARYKKHLVESTGHDTGQLPVPAVFLADKDGTITFVFSEPDYKVRLSNEDLLAAVKSTQN